MNFKTKKMKEIEKELTLYKREEILLIDEELAKYRKNSEAKMAELARSCGEDTADYEHEYHSTMELRKVELAKLEAKVEETEKVVSAREEVIKADQNLLNSKQNEIDRLNNIIEKLIDKETIIINTKK